MIDAFNTLSIFTLHLKKHLDLMQLDSYRFVCFQKTGLIMVPMHKLTARGLNTQLRLMTVLITYYCCVF